MKRQMFLFFIIKFCKSLSSVSRKITNLPNFLCLFNRMKKLTKKFGAPFNIEFMKINPTKSAGEVQPLVASFEPRVECGNGNNAELFYN